MLHLCIVVFIMLGTCVLLYRNKKQKVQDEIFRKLVEEDLRKQADRLTVSQILEHDKKLMDKINKLH